jgi:hypothetical protein
MLPSQNWLQKRSLQIDAKQKKAMHKKKNDSEKPSTFR